MKELDVNACNARFAEFMGESECRYDIGYDNIMRVIEKIESLGFIVSNDQSDTTVLEQKAFASAFVLVYGTRHKISKSESFYRAAIDFLNWYESKSK